MGVTKMAVGGKEEDRQGFSIDFMNDNLPALVERQLENLIIGAVIKKITYIIVDELLLSYLCNKLLNLRFIKYSKVNDFQYHRRQSHKYLRETVQESHR